MHSTEHEEHAGNVTIASDLSIYIMMVQSENVKMNTSADRKNGADANSVESRSYGWLISTLETRHQQQLSTPYPKSSHGCNYNRDPDHSTCIQR